MKYEFMLFSPWLLKQPSEETLALKPQYIWILNKNPNKDPRFLNQVPT